MPSTFGQWLIVILAILLGTAAGWVLRGRRGAPATGTPIVEGDPVAGVAVMSAPAAEATVDTKRPEATIAPAAETIAVVDRPAPETAEATPPGAVLHDSDPAVFTPGGLADAASDPAVSSSAVSSSADAASPIEAATPALTDPAEDTPPVIHRPEEPSADEHDPARTDEPTTGTESRTTPVSEAEPTFTPESPVAPATASQPEVEPLTASEPTGETTPTRAGAVPVQPVSAEAVSAEATPTEDAPADGDASTRAAVAEDAPVSTPAAPVPAIPAPRVAADDAEPPATDAPVGVNEQAPSTPTASPVTTPTPGSTEAEAGVVDGGGAAAADDFRRIQGIGPKMATALQNAGIRTYRQLADLDEAALRDTIRTAGLRAAPSLATWPQQARVLAGAPAEAERTFPVPAGDSPS